MTHYANVTYTTAELAPAVTLLELLAECIAAYGPRAVLQEVL